MCDDIDVEKKLQRYLRINMYDQTRQYKLRIRRRARVYVSKEKYHIFKEALIIPARRVSLLPTLVKHAIESRYLDKSHTNV